MPLAINDVVQFTYRSSWQGQIIMLLSEWQVQTTTSAQSVPDDLSQLAIAFGTAGAGTPLAAYLDCLGNNVTVDVCRAQRVAPVRSIYEEATVALSGTGATSAETGNLAGAVARITAAAGRDQIATSHLGPMPSGQVTNGSVSAGYQLKMGIYAARFLNPFSVTFPNIGLVPCIWHRKKVPQPAVSYPVSSRVQTTVRTMHRRTVGLGI